MWESRLKKGTSAPVSPETRQAIAHIYERCQAQLQFKQATKVYSSYSCATTNHSKKVLAVLELALRDIAFESSSPNPNLLL